MTEIHFPTNTALPVITRTYLRDNDNRLETPFEAFERVIEGIAYFGDLTKEELGLIKQNLFNLKAFPSGRQLWYGGTKNSQNPKNYPGLYNCCSLPCNSVEAFRKLFDFLMLGCGVGLVVTKDNIDCLPQINNLLNISIKNDIQKINDWNKKRALTKTQIKNDLFPETYTVIIGDSRQGWIDAFMFLIDQAIKPIIKNKVIKIKIDLSNIRPKGVPIKGFGGTANPTLLPQLFPKTASILNSAYRRKLTATECCLIAGEISLVVVSGNVRRSAGIRQGSDFDVEFAISKQDLWQQDEKGNWYIDPNRDCLRMANHTRVFHRKPTLQECIESVQKQYFSGEGAIQYAPEAIARGNTDILKYCDRSSFLQNPMKWLVNHGYKEKELKYRVNRYGLNPCGEIIGSSFFCNLSEVHLNQLTNASEYEINQAFTSAGLIAASLLHQQFTYSDLQESRELDPIVGVSFTGLFDFFVHKLGSQWLQWWQAGRPKYWFVQGKLTKYYLSDYFRSAEIKWLSKFRAWVEEAVHGYCDRHGLKRPNRCTTVQPSGTKSLLTGASPGWHPPKSTRYIRRITFQREDPVALTCMDFGYNVIPSQMDKDKNGQLLNNPFDSRCTEWLIEVPIEVSWAAIADNCDFDPSKISATAQFDFAMQVQQHYTTHNTSATIELTEDEIMPLATAIYEAIAGDQGYVSFALLARFDSLETFPRLPFEPISKKAYQKLNNQIKIPTNQQFAARLEHWRSQKQFQFTQVGPASCDSDKCFFSEKYIK